MEEAFWDGYKMANSKNSALHSKKKRVQIQTQHSSEDTKNQTINVATIKVQ